MSQSAEELLESLTGEEISNQPEEPKIEGHIVIGDDRFITVPEELKRIGVQFDHDIETVTFDCPRYWDEHDMSKMAIYINYMRPDGVIGSYIADNIRVDGVEADLATINTGAGSLKCVTYGNEMYVAVSNTNEGSVYCSTDFLAWTKSGSIGELVSDITFGGDGKFVAVTVEGKIFYSLNGVTWTETFDTNGHLYNVSYLNDRFITCGTNVYYSLDGLTWTESTGTTGQIMEVIYGPGMYMASGNHIYFSENGAHWTVADTENNPYLYFDYIAYGDGKYISATWDGCVYNSENGTEWKFVYKPGEYPASMPAGMAFGEGMYVLVTSSGHIYYSEDTTNWLFYTSIARDISDVAYINDMFVITDHTGCIHKLSFVDISSDVMHFDWTISRNVTEVQGNISFLVCIKNTDSEGYEKNHWNSELNKDMYISEGLECTEVVLSEYPDIISGLLIRMDTVEDTVNRNTSKEAMTEYVNTYFADHPEAIEKCVADYMKSNKPTSPEAMQEYVNNYLDENPPLIVIGPNKPGMECLWFDTSISGDTNENVVLDLIDESVATGVYAEVNSVMYGVKNTTVEQGPTGSSYDFDII